MTAPDPRLEEIEAALHHAESYGYPSFLIATTHVAYLLAELRKAQDKLGRVEGLCGSWQEMATTTNTADTTLRAAIYAIRAAVADATGGGE